MTMRSRIQLPQSCQLTYALQRKHTQNSPLDKQPASGTHPTRIATDAPTLFLSHRSSLAALNRPRSRTFLPFNKLNKNNEKLNFW